jgi:hypothetical protein
MKRRAELTLLYSGKLELEPGPEWMTGHSEIIHMIDVITNLPGKQIESSTPIGLTGGFRGFPSRHTPAR